jgi:hypothetical protein
MKKLGITIFLFTNLFLSHLYIIDIINYFNRTYNYDGIRYFLPLVLGDSLFLISIVILFIVYRFSRYLFGFIFIIVLHNLAVSSRYLPFIGLGSVVLAFIYILMIRNRRKLE